MDSNKGKVLSGLLHKNIVFHYTKHEVALQSILHAGSFRFFKFGQTIDPFERLLGRNGPRVGASMRGIEDKHFDEIVHYQSQLLEVYQNTWFGSFCQSSGKVDTYIKVSDYCKRLGCCKPRMWDQYGGRFTGVCLAFDKTLLKSLLEEQHPEQVWSGSLEYDLFGDMTDVSTHVRKRAENAGYSFKDFLSDNYKHLYFWKHPDYGDEKEWRICVYNNEQCEAAYTELHIENALMAIVYCTDDFSVKECKQGDLFPNAYMQMLKQYAYKYDVPLIALIFEDREMGIELIDTAPAGKQGEEQKGPAHAS
ncbi:MAG: DUF2971 domain-containing protein [Deltaproteobacteria bacterium]|nr:DUF2971 domain-containing protein [Deltaproteobacteria bacterium]